MRSKETIRQLLYPVPGFLRLSAALVVFAGLLMAPSLARADGGNSIANAPILAPGAKQSVSLPYTYWQIGVPPLSWTRFG